MIADLIIRWTARMAVACYVMRLFCDATGGRSTSSREAARWWWTIGCGWFISHVVAAFQFMHRWSHQAAFESTARRTLEMTGWNSGIGLYVNYAFLALWIADTAFWWRDIDWPDTHRRINRTIMTVFAFLIVQATAVFGLPFWKPIVLAVVMGFIYQFYRNRATESQQDWRATRPVRDSDSD